jgi:GST-like protein
MIDLHYWPTPNGHKVSILLEELEVPYAVFPVNIGRGEQFHPEFLKLSPNNRMPAVVDRDPAGGGEPIAMFESGAILMYLAEKYGRFLPQDVRGRYEVVQWVMWQMGGLGPMLGQNNHFRNYAPEQVPYAKDRYFREAERLYGVLDRRLADREFVAGAYSVADIASFPWARGADRQGIDLAGYPNVARWITTIAARPAVVRGLAVGADLSRPLDDEARKHLFASSRPA